MVETHQFTTAQHKEAVSIGTAQMVCTETPHV